MNLRVTLIGIIVFLGQKCTTDFASRLAELTADVLGVEYMQQYLDNEVELSSFSISGETVITQLAENLGEKFGSRTNMLRKIQRTIEENYHDYKYEYRFNQFYYCCEEEIHESFNHKFKDAVSTDRLCIRESAVAGNDKRYATSELLDAFQDNFLDVNANGVKWQYFGTEQGVLFSFPAVVIENCDSYDPRFRPWYVQTATPDPKDVVIVIDVSGSMEYEENRYDGRYLIDIAKEAAITVLETLNPKDRVNVVMFSTYAATPELRGQYECLSTVLAYARPSNIKALTDYVSQLRVGGGTMYSRGLEKAFDLFDNTQENTELINRSATKVILFLTDGDPQEEKAAVLSLIDTRNAALNNEVTIFTFGIGEITDTGVDILSDMANRPHGQSQPGLYMHLSNPSHLRAEMALYYNYFSRPIEEPMISVPFFDSQGLGMIITISLPVFIDNDFVGVVGIDLSLADMLEAASFLQEGIGVTSYAFVIDKSGQTLNHPIMTQPTDLSQEAMFVSIRDIEVDPGVVDVINDMTGGGKGHKSKMTKRFLLLGGGNQGFIEYEVSTEYYWEPVSGTDFSVCLVLTTGEENHSMDGMFTSSITPFLYHQLNITDLSDDSFCRLFIRTAVKDTSSVKFSAKAFLNPMQYLDTIETTETWQKYKRIIQNGASNDMFTTGVLEAIQMTSKVHDLWFGSASWSNYKFVIWRYIATPSGVLRATPATTLAKTYDPTARSWYKNAVAHPESIVVSTPYLDAFGAGNLVTISKALYYSGHHGELSFLAGVMAIDVSLGYFYHLLSQDNSQCLESVGRCFLLDRDGYVVIQKNYLYAVDSESPVDASMHVVYRERSLAHQLLDEELMVRKICYDYTAFRKSYFFSVNGSSGMAPSVEYELQIVSGSSLFQGTIGHNAASPTCLCPGQPTHEILKCADPYETCQCPCWSDASYQACNNSFKTEGNAVPKPCMPKSPSIDLFSQVQLEYIDYLSSATGMPKCFNVMCSSQEDEMGCYSIIGCSWCVRKRDGSRLTRPYCSEQLLCFSGQQFFPNPYSKMFDLPEIHSHALLIGLTVTFGILLPLAGFGIYICMSEARKQKLKTLRHDEEVNEADKPEEEIYCKSRIEMEALAEYSDSECGSASVTDERTGGAQQLQTSPLSPTVALGLDSYIVPSRTSQIN